MSKKLYVGNLSFSATDQTLMDTFASFGAVDSAKIITDRDSGRSKGFAFVEMASDSDAEAAISQLNGKDLMGRALVVSEAKPMAPREGGGRSGGFGRRPGGGGGGGSDRRPRSGGGGGFGGGY